MNRPVVGYILAGLALAMLALAFGEVWSPLTRTTFGVTLVPQGNRAAVATIQHDSAAYKAGVRRGDLIDLTRMPLGTRLRLVTNYSPVGRRIAVPVRHDGRAQSVTFVAQASQSTYAITFGWSTVVNALISLVIVAVIAWRKPSTATAALVLYGMGSCTTFQVIGEFSWLADPWYATAAAFINIAFGALPIAALLPFIVRFPQDPVTPSGRARMHAADALFVVSAAFFTFETLCEPLLFATWYGVDTAVELGLTAIVLLFALLAYRDAQGEARRRIGWVIAGLVVGAIGYTAADFIESLPSIGYVDTHGILAPANSIAQLLQAALPLALGYAVLRHRVLDLGFALNRTVVYGAITALVVAVVSLVDWVSGRLISEQRWALVIEALITIGFGFALNWIHARTERLVDRIVFRARHLAEKRVEYRIGALGFASSASSVDDAIATEAPRILDLSSAAVFGRLAADEMFTRNASYGWGDETTAAIADDSLLVRTLRSLERPIVLDDVAIALDRIPSGSARPAIAIPIVTQHELIGFALFGARHDGALPDPEEIGLLAKLCSAAGSAYGAVEARQWRERAAALERSLAGAVAG